VSLLTFSISNFSVSKSLGVLDTDGVKIVITREQRKALRICCAGRRDHVTVVVD